MGMEQTQGVTLLGAPMGAPSSRAPHYPLKAPCMTSVTTLLAAAGKCVLHKQLAASKSTFMHQHITVLSMHHGEHWL